MNDDAAALLAVLLLVGVIFLTPILWVLASGRSRGLAKFGWFIIVCWFSWLGLAAFFILTNAPRDTNHS